MKPATIMKICVDVVMYLLFLLLMGQYLLRGAVHECSCYIEKHNKTRQGQPAPPLFRTAEGR